MLEFFRVNALDVKRLGNPVLEGMRKVIVNHPMRLFYLLSVALSCQRIGPQLWARTFYDVGNVYAKGKRAPIDKCEVQIAFSRLAEEVFLNR